MKLKGLAICVTFMALVFSACENINTNSNANANANVNANMATPAATPTATPANDRAMHDEGERERVKGKVQEGVSHARRVFGDAVEDIGEKIASGS